MAEYLTILKIAGMAKQRQPTGGVIHGNKRTNMNKVEYTTVNIFSDGDWFNDIKVQVRQNSNWMDVTGMIASPVYPNNNSAGRNVTYTFTFNNITGDGVRIISTPGGTAHFTSLGELGVHYNGNTN